MNPLTFDNRVALVTGGSTGIGAATAVKLGSCGVKVAINYYNSGKEAEEVARRVKLAEGKALLIQADVRQASQVNEMVKRTVNEFGRIDILVNNAGGLLKRVPVADMTDDLWDSTMDLNLRSVFYCSKAVMPLMVKARYGRIVNVSSVAAFTGGGRHATAYATAKAGLHGFTKGLAKELAPFGITVNVVAPGLIDTPFHVKAETGGFDQFMPGIPLKRAGTADEVASLISYLASDNAGYSTGTVFNVNGGMV
jgi:3-oxoacyl-[acyl-carrier protein] reductase